MNRNQKSSQIEADARLADEKLRVAMLITSSIAAFSTIACLFLLNAGETTLGLLIGAFSGAILFQTIVFKQRREQVHAFQKADQNR